MPLNSKKGKASFKRLVNGECASKDVLTTETVRKLSQPARSYISCAYYTLHQQKLLNNGDKNNPTLPWPLIKRLMKEFKTHRAAVDFDAGGFVNSFMSPALQLRMLSSTL